MAAARIHLCTTTKGILPSFRDQDGDAGNWDYNEDSVREKWTFWIIARVAAGFAAKFSKGVSTKNIHWDRRGGRLLDGIHAFPNYGLCFSGQRDPHDLLDSHALFLRFRRRSQDKWTIKPSLPPRREWEDSIDEPILGGTDSLTGYAIRVRPDAAEEDSRIQLQHHIHRIRIRTGHWYMSDNLPLKSTVKDHQPLIFGLSLLRHRKSMRKSVRRTQEWVLIYRSRMPGEDHASSFRLRLRIAQRKICHGCCQRTHSFAPDLSTTTELDPTRGNPGLQQETFYECLTRLYTKGYWKEWRIS